MLGRQRDAKARELGELLMPPRLLGERVPLADEGDGVSKGAAQHRHDRPDMCVGRQVAGQQIDREIARWLRFSRIAESDERDTARKLDEPLRIAPRTPKERAIEDNDRGALRVETRGIGQHRYATHFDVIGTATERCRRDHPADSGDQQRSHGRQMVSCRTCRASRGCSWPAGTRGIGR